MIFLKQKEVHLSCCFQAVLVYQTVNLSPKSFLGRCQWDVVDVARAAKFLYLDCRVGLFPRHSVITFITVFSLIFNYSINERLLIKEINNMFLHYYTCTNISHWFINVVRFIYTEDTYSAQNQTFIESCYRLHRFCSEGQAKTWNGIPYYYTRSIEWVHQRHSPS